MSEKLFALNEEYLRCPECDAYRHHRTRRWESSIAVIIDEECIRCRHIFDREVTRKTILKGKNETLYALQPD